MVFLFSISKNLLGLLSQKSFCQILILGILIKIGLTHNGDFISKLNDVVLDFPYKDCVLEGGQDKDDQKRKEMFYNENHCKR